MDLFIWIFLSLAGCFWIFGWVVSARFRTVPMPSPEEPVGDVSLSVVIPARNEEENLARLLPSLTSQEDPPDEIVVVDDQSEDRTAEMAEAHGARVISGGDLPDGWLGKPWACQQGAEAASGKWILFLDADTVLEPGGLLRIRHLATRQDTVHSICPHHRVEEPYEELSAFFNIVMLLGMNAFTLRGDRADRIGLFGQALLVSREQYDAVGGHSAVKDEVLENFHLSRPLAEAGYRCRCYLGKGTLWMRMFPTGLDDLVAGWSKGFVSGAGNTPRGALIGISFWLSGLIIGMISLLFLPLASGSAAAGIGILYGLCVVQTAYLMRSAGSFRLLGAILFPVGLCFYQGLFFRAVRRKKQGGRVQWKGRDVG